MFLKFIKDFGLKKIISKSLSNYKPISSPDVVTTVGLLIDESYFTGREALINDLVANGIARQDIKILGFKDRIKPKEIIESPYFTRKDIASGGEFKKEDVAEFINAPFDMLISYYDIEKAPLVWATIRSKAKFKVGFATVNKRLNHFMISSVTEKHGEFTAELFKYLKILNKL